MDSNSTLTGAQEAEILAKFQALHDYGARKAMFEANPCLAKTYCASNFSAPAPVKPAPAPEAATQ